MATPDDPEPENAGDVSRRVTWPDVAVLMVVMGFAIFLMSRGLSIYIATITAVGTASAVLGMLLLPRRLAEAVKLLRAISHAVGSSPTGTRP